MTLELLLYLGGGLVPVLTWSWVVLRLMRDIHAQNAELITMHLDADKWGFGTKKLTKEVESLRRGIPELIHYQRWVYKAITKSDPPPYVGDAES